MKKRTFEVKNSYYNRPIEVFYNDKDQVVKAFNDAGTHVIDNVVYDGEKIVSVSCPNVGCTFTLCPDGTYDRVNTNGSRESNYKDLNLLPIGLLKFILPGGQLHSFGTTPPPGRGALGIQHRCSNGQCYEQKAFDTFKRFWSLQDSQPLPSSIWRTSFHEAAHATIAISRGILVEEMTIVGTADYHGRVKIDRSTTGCRAHLDTALAGFVLDQASRVADTGAEKDLIAAYRLAIEVCAEDPKAWLDNDDTTVDFAFTGNTGLAMCIKDHPFEAKAEALVLERIFSVLTDMSDMTEQIVAVASCVYEKKTIVHVDIERIMNAPYTLLADTYEEEASQLAGALSDWQLAIRKVTNS